MKVRIFRWYLVLLGLQLSLGVHSQRYWGEISTLGIASFGEYSPFWLVNNHYGKYSVDKGQFLNRAQIYRQRDTSRLFSFSGGLDVLGGYKGEWTIYPHQAFVRMDAGFLFMRLGRQEEVYGNQEAELSLGGTVFSRNARPIPQFLVSTDDYTAVPFTHRYLEFKGMLSHGWFGKEGYVKDAFLHHKNLYFRIGGDLPVNLSAGLEHFAQWGGRSPDFGNMPTGLDAYWDIFWVRHGSPEDLLIPGEIEGRIGNHLGAYNYRIDLKLSRYLLGLYYQTIFEDRSGYIEEISPDGLWGFSLKSRNMESLINEVLLEYLNTNYQSGPRLLDDQGNMLGGNDNYFNHSIFEKGWTYYGFSIGTPMITNPAYGDTSMKIWNNKVKAWHVGLKGYWRETIPIKVLCSYSRNYGVNDLPYEKKKDQLSILAEFSVPVISDKWNLGVNLGLDLGKQYGRNGGILLSLSRRFPVKG